MQLNQLSSDFSQMTFEWAKALAGAKDRWSARQEYHAEAIEIYRQVETASQEVRSIANQKFRELGTTALAAPPIQQVSVLTFLINGLVKNPIDFPFGLSEWVKYLPKSKRRHYDVVFIGGGPVGLWTAILAKVRKAELSILILEKRTTYVRNHALGIDRDSFDGYPAAKNADLDAIVSNFKDKRVVPIQEVEKSLFTLAQKIGIQIAYVTVSNPAEEIPLFFESTKVVVGSDGARSLVRHSVFGDQFRFQQTLERLIQINYQIEKTGKTANFKLSWQNLIGYKTLAAMRSTLIDENTSQKEDRTEKTLTFSVSQAVLDVIKPATFAAPYTLKQPNLPEDISHDFYLWCGMKEEVYGEVRVVDSERITAIGGEARISQSFVKAHNGKIWFLLGDAAASFPLQRGFNTGLRLGIELSDTLQAYFNTPADPLIQGDGIEGAVPSSFKAYAVFGTSIEGMELCFLKCPLDYKTKGIGAWKVVRGIGQLLPSFSNLDSTTEARYLKIGRETKQTAMSRASTIQKGVTDAVRKYEEEKNAHDKDDEKGGDGNQPTLSLMDKMQSLIAAYKANKQ